MYRPTHTKKCIHHSICHDLTGIAENPEFHSERQIKSCVPLDYENIHLWFVFSRMNDNTLCNLNLKKDRSNVIPAYSNHIRNQILAANAERIRYNVNLYEW